ncbi:MAG TPA: FecR domain-containing protein [Chitinophaga sp.]
MNEKDALALLEKYVAGHCSDEEKAILESWYLQHHAAMPPVSDAQKAQQLTDIRQALFAEEKPARYRLRYRAAAAAVVLLLLGAGALLLTHTKRKQAVVMAATDIKPGGNRATLVLSDGRAIVLDNYANGQVVNEAGLMITKVEDRSIIYDVKGGAAAAGVNKLITPMGGQYQVTLSDGTKVWLNAASTLEFPAAFTGGERNVTLSGEAYFEVMKNPRQPFKVQARDVNIRVLGTHFNVMAYAEEGVVKTTLVEGAVVLNNSRAKALLKPGQQGYTSGHADGFHVDKVNVSPVTAWKTGWFEFDSTSLHTLMGQVARWYDVKVVYEPGVKEDVFFGRIPRSASLSALLKVLAAGGLHCEIRDNILIIKP